MTINLSPSIVTNGLVFSMDANSRNSYTGPPIQNKTGGISFAGVGTGTGYVCTSVTEVIDIPQLGPTTVYTSNIQNNYGTSGSCCPSLFQYGGYAVTGSTVYTYGIVYRSQSGYTHPNFMYRYEYNGGTYVIEAGVHDTSKRIALGNGWWWAWNTFTTQPSTNLISSSGLWYYQYSSFSDKISVAKIFVTQGDYTGLHPKYWPNMNSTKSNTQALVDLTGNNILTANSLTYASDGTFSFDGGSNYITVPDSANIRPVSGSITTIVWFKATGSNGQDASILINKENEYEISAGGGYISYAFRPNWAWVGHTSFSLNTWYCVAITYDQSYQKMYINGVERYSAALSGAMGAYTEPLKIGARGGAASTYAFFPGYISIVQIYNRGLSASEVLQNFNALKERFFGYVSLTYTASTNVTLTNNGTQGVTMFKNADAGSWNGQVYSLEKFTAPCTIEFLKNAQSYDNGQSYAMIGWNADPTTDSSYGSIDHASYPFMMNRYEVYNNGSYVNPGVTWDTNKRFYVVYDTDGYIRHYNEGTLLYTANYGTGNIVYVDSSFYSVNSTYGGFTDVKVCRKSWNGSSYV